MEKIRCYLYRKTSSRQWIAATNDLPILSVACQEPEDALRRMQVHVLREIANQIDDDPSKISDKLDISIVFEIISEDDASRLLQHKDPDPYDYGLP